ncbi:MAG TPA: FAD-dependent oxidoreductase [Pseudolabrys sp.]|nr:FAD-dependent oxidoreductase [Pseudolabrys sp.]
MRLTPESAPTSTNVIGAGIAGTWQALLFAKAGRKVAVYERDGPAMTQATSHWAGGMLAPHCESEAAEPVITRLGLRSLELWREALPDTPFNGSLVVAHGRDRADFERFARLASGYRRIAAGEIAALEPALAGRFTEALFFPAEGHVEPRRVLPALHARLNAAGVPIQFNSAPEPRDLDGLVIDCRGLAARDTCPNLRGVKGEMIVIETDEIALSRPVRLIHPRWPLYIVPRTNKRFMIGASAIETESEGVSVRSALELLSAAYAVHPAFGEARIAEFGAGLRPAFPDNLPRITVENTRIGINGLYRHGFLLAPAIAEITVAHVLGSGSDSEVVKCA